MNFSVNLPGPLPAHSLELLLQYRPVFPPIFRPNLRIQTHLPYSSLTWSCFSLWTLLVMIKREDCNYGSCGCVKLKIRLMRDIYGRGPSSPDRLNIERTRICTPGNVSENSVKFMRKSPGNETWYIGGCSVISRIPSIRYTCHLSDFSLKFPYNLQNSLRNFTWSTLRLQTNSVWSCDLLLIKQAGNLGCQNYRNRAQLTSNRNVRLRPVSAGTIICHQYHRRRIWQWSKYRSVGVFLEIFRCACRFNWQS